MTATNIVQRPAITSDAKSLAKFLDALADENLDTVSGIRPTAAAEAEFIERAAQSERALILIALDGNDVIGMLDLWGGEKPINQHMGRLGTSVLAPYRRKGVAQNLLRAAIHEARTWPDFCRIELDVVPWNEPAIRLYETAGFIREGTKRKAALIAGKPVDVVQMALVW